MKKKRDQSARLIQLDSIECCACNVYFSPDDVPDLDTRTGSYQHKDCTPRRKTNPSFSHYHDRVMRLEAPAIPSTLDQYEIEMLAAHNVIRQRHGVNHVLWSRKLAAEARRWGIRLSVLNKDHHSKSNIIVSIKNHVSYGQNVGLVFSRKMSTPQIVDQSVESWYGNTTNMYDYRCEAPQSEMLAFTQIIWEKTVRIGGCLTWFGDIGFVIVNYWPAGNVVGQFIKNVFPVLHPDIVWGAESGSDDDTTRDYLSSEYSAEGGEFTSHSSTEDIADEESRGSSRDITGDNDSGLSQENLMPKETGNCYDQRKLDANIRQSAGISNDDLYYETPVELETRKKSNSKKDDNITTCSSNSKIIAPHGNDNQGNHSSEVASTHPDLRQNKTKNEEEKTSSESTTIDVIHKDTDNEYVEIADLDLNQTEGEDIYEYMESPQAGKESHQYDNLQHDAVVEDGDADDDVDDDVDDDDGDVDDDNARYMTMRPSTGSDSGYRTLSSTDDHDSGVKGSHENVYEDLCDRGDHDYETLSKFKVKKKRSWGKKPPSRSSKDVPLVMVQSGLALAVYQEPELDVVSEGSNEDVSGNNIAMTSEGIEKSTDRRTSEWCDENFRLVFPGEPKIENGLIEEDFDEDNYTRTSVLEGMVTYEIRY